MRSRPVQRLFRLTSVARRTEGNHATHEAVDQKHGSSHCRTPQQPTETHEAPSRREAFYSVADVENLKLRPRSHSVHYLRYTSPDWELACGVVSQLWSCARRQHYHPCLNPRGLRTLTNGLFLPCVSTPHAWQTAVLLLQLTLMQDQRQRGEQRGGEPPGVGLSGGAVANTGNTPPTTESMRRVLRRYYMDPSAAVHTLRCVSLAGGGHLWHQACLLYAAACTSHHGMGNNVPHLSSSTPSAPVYPDSVLRAMRLHTFSSILDYSHWAMALRFFRHMLRHHDYPHSLSTGHLFKCLQQHGKWQETLLLLETVASLVQAGAVASSRYASSAEELRVVRWNGVICQGLTTVVKAVEQHAMPAETCRDAFGAVQAMIPTLQLNGYLTAAAQQLRLNHVATTPSDNMSLGGQSTKNSQSTAALTRGLVQRGLWEESLASFCDHVDVVMQRVSSSNAMEGAEGGKGEVPSGAPHDLMGQLKTALELREFVLTAAPRGCTCVLHIRSCLGHALRSLVGCVVQQLSDADHHKGALGVEARRALRADKEIVMSKLGGGRHSAVPIHSGVWLSALSLLHLGVENDVDETFRWLWWSPNDESSIPTVPTVQLETTSSQAVSFAVRVGMPPDIAEATVRYYHPVLSAATMKADHRPQSTSSTASTTPKTTPLSPLHLAWLSVAEQHLRHFLRSQQQTGHDDGGAQTDHLASCCRIVGGLMSHHRVSPTAFLLAHIPTASHLLPILEHHGDTVAPAVLYHAVAAPIGTEDRIGRWVDAMRIVEVCAQRSAQCLNETATNRMQRGEVNHQRNNPQSFFEVVPMAAMIAVLRRSYGMVGAGGLSAVTAATVSVPADDLMDPTYLWRKATDWWNWATHTQRHCLTVANNATTHIPAQNAILLAMEVSLALLHSAESMRCLMMTNEERTSSSSHHQQQQKKQFLTAEHVASRSSMQLSFALDRHKLRPPLFSIGVTYLERFLPQTLFHTAAADGGPREAFFLEDRLKCIKVLCACILRRCADKAALFSEKNRSDALFQVLKYASRAERLAALYGIDASQRDGDHGTAAQSPVATPLWYTALSALADADAYAGGVGSFPDSYFAHAVTALPTPTDDAEWQRNTQMVQCLLLQAAQRASKHHNGCMKALLVPLAIQRLLLVSDWRASLGILLKHQPTVTMEVLHRCCLGSGGGSNTKEGTSPPPSVVDPLIVMTAMDMLDVLQRRGGGH